MYLIHPNYTCNTNTLISEYKMSIIILEYKDCTPWSDWTACSETCGSGEKKRERQCKDSSLAEDVKQKYDNSTLLVQGGKMRTEHDISYCVTQQCPGINTVLYITVLPCSS